MFKDKRYYMAKVRYYAGLIATALVFSLIVCVALVLA